MNNMEWNKKQIELFELYFKNNEGIKVSEIMNNIKKYSKIWQKFYDFLIESSLDFDKFDDIDKIKIINYNNINYLIIKFRIFDYLCIDLDNRKVIKKNNNNLEPFNEEFFIKNFNEHKIEEPEVFYYYLNINKKDMNEIIEFINNNLILLQEISFTYKIDNGDYMTFLNFDIGKEIITIYFGNKTMVGNINYIFIDRNLNPIVLSNPTGNKDELKEMVLNVKDIVIPTNVIPEYILSKNKVKVY